VSEADVFGLEGVPLFKKANATTPMVAVSRVIVTGAAKQRIV